MENEEKKNPDTAPVPEPTPEETAKKLRDKNDLRTFGIAIMAAIIVVAVYHIGRLSIRKYLRSKNPPVPIKSCDCKHFHDKGPRRGKRPGKRPGKRGHGKRRCDQDHWAQGSQDEYGESRYEHERKRA